jgi:hypothetical protein
LIWRKVGRRSHCGRGYIAPTGCIPAIVPNLDNLPSIGTVDATRNGRKAVRLYFRRRLPKALPSLDDLIPKLNPRHERPPRIAAIRPAATEPASRACMRRPPNKCAWRESHHRSMACKSKFPVSGSGGGKPRAIRLGSFSWKTASVMPKRRAAHSTGASRGSTRKRILSLWLGAGLFG